MNFSLFWEQKKQYLTSKSKIQLGSKALLRSPRMWEHPVEFSISSFWGAHSHPTFQNIPQIQKRFGMQYGGCSLRNASSNLIMQFFENHLKNHVWHLPWLFTFATYADALMCSGRLEALFINYCCHLPSMYIMSPDPFDILTLNTAEYQLILHNLPLSKPRTNMVSAQKQSLGWALHRRHGGLLSS